MLAINNSRTQTRALNLPIESARYILGAPQLENTTVLLNGKPLALGPGNTLPSLTDVPTAAGPVALAPATISFFVFADARNPQYH